ncbi:MAG: hypothetical protein JRI57_01250 [Deltaproteobacteria bacterium]|nr:hypothetical protein [Deltaproteobacteria bacterium]MBW1952984.1 hypothetical protein [Deltaproteobacteria bacterium]MBW1985957.1 hypothetical protein [Deltaproteobacteria bacterium]MBW2133717.1 hypothetical protein [Deltaproteobacteria bacterium]
MTNFKYDGSLNINISPQSENYFLESNCNLIFNDLIFFLNQAAVPELEQETSNRYARVAIAYMAFYIESLANLVFGFVGEMVNSIISLEYISCFHSLQYIFKNKTKNHLSEPIKNQNRP